MDMTKHSSIKRIAFVANYQNAIHSGMASITGSRIHLLFFKMGVSLRFPPTCIWRYR